MATKTQNRYASNTRPSVSPKIEADDGLESLPESENDGDREHNDANTMDIAAMPHPRRRLWRFSRIIATLNTPCREKVGTPPPPCFLALEQEGAK
jgi:hypothetical protein